MAEEGCLIIRDRIIDLRRVPAAELRANPRNWRRHPAHQQRALRSVLEQVGYADALLARETPDGLELIDGHLRQELTPEQEVPVLVLDVDEAEANLILTTLDPLAGMAEVDGTALAALLESVTLDDAGLGDYLRDLAGAPVMNGHVDPDDVPEPPAEPVTKPGDLWLLGEHRLLCGDAADPAITARALEGIKDRLMVTDPPYGVDYTEVMAGRANQKHGGWRPIENDELRADALADLLVAAFAESSARTAFVWFAHDQRLFVERALRQCKFDIKQEIVWVKSALVFSRADYHWRHEQAIYATRPGHMQPPTRDQTTVWEVDKATDSQHPTQKPVELYRRSLENHTEPGDWLYDPFAGSGTALVAAEATGRRATTIEIDPVYVDVAVARWQTFTGRKAEREG